MRLFRIAPGKFGGDLSGAGARLYGGRWTPKGALAVYTSESPALAALEVLVHMPVDMAPAPLVFLEIEFPDDLEVASVGLTILGNNWQAYPFPESTVKLGGEWIKRNTPAALKVPSAIMPHGKGWNYILNPLSVEFSRVKIIGREPFHFAGRLLKR